MERYFCMAQLLPSFESRLFRGIVCIRKGECLRASGTLSYTRMRELFKAKLLLFVFDASQFGLHSLRARGVSAAANAGIPDRLFGRWRSETAKDGYIKDSMSALLSVSASLEL